MVFRHDVTELRLSLWLSQVIPLPISFPSHIITLEISWVSFGTSHLPRDQLFSIVVPFGFLDLSNREGKRGGHCYFGKEHTPKK